MLCELCELFIADRHIKLGNPRSINHYNSQGTQSEEIDPKEQ